jgi:RNA polymerase-binding transcription factor DksA
MNSDTSLRKRRGRTPYGFEDLNRFRVLLGTLREEFSKRLEGLGGSARRTIGEALGDLASLPAQPGSEGAGEHARALEFLAEAERITTEIDDALERIDNRSYGLCEVCERPIPLVRLLAVPYGRTCVACDRDPGA